MGHVSAPFEVDIPDFFADLPLRPSPSGASLITGAVSVMGELPLSTHCGPSRPAIGASADAPIIERAPGGDSRHLVKPSMARLRQHGGVGCPAVSGAL